MSKAANLRKKLGFYVPRDGSHRTHPTTGNLGPRDPGPHGKTLNQPRHVRAARIESYIDQVLRPRKGPE